MDELISKIKNLNPMTRAMTAAVLAILPSVYLLWTEVEKLEQERQTAQSELDSANVAFNKAKSQSKALPKKMEALESIKKELVAIRKILPNEFIVDEILHTTASLAKSSGVKVNSFTPMPNVKAKKDAKYIEIPIALSLSGSFVNLATFFDKIVHLDKIVYLRNIKLSSSGAGDNKGSIVNNITNPSLSVEISANTTMVLFNSL